MYNITKSNNSIVITNGNNQIAFPLNAISLHADDGDNQSVEIRLIATKKPVLSFRYDDCNLSGTDAQKTLENIVAIL